MPRKRKFDPTIPKHIDQGALPVGVYWDKTGNGRWFVVNLVEGIPKRKTVATARARLSELHAIAEARKGVERGSIAWLLGEFHKSPTFGGLAPRTQRDYEYQRSLCDKHRLRNGQVLSSLEIAKLSAPFFQRLVDTITAAGTPTKANHLLRYLRRVFSWGVNRAYCESNPAAGVELAKERRARVVPDPEKLSALASFARTRGALSARTAGSCPPYLWIVIELCYLCRLRPIEAITLTDAHCTDTGLITNRRKGSRDSLVRWSPRLRAAVDAAVEYRKVVIARHSRPTPIRPEERTLIVSEYGQALVRSSLDSAWQRFMAMAVKEGMLKDEERFGLHAMKHRGISDTPGTRPEKQLASGHRTEAMLEVYDHSVPIVDAPN